MKQDPQPYQSWILLHPSNSTTPLKGKRSVASFEVMIAILTGMVKRFSKKRYYDAIAALELYQLTCSCGHSGCLIVHGYYERTVRTPFGSMRIRVLRVMCKECGHTHALLPEILVPYSQLPANIEKNNSRGCKCVSVIVLRLWCRFKWRNRCYGLFPIKTHSAERSK